MRFGKRFLGWKKKLKIQSAEVQRLKEELLTSQARLLARAEAAGLKRDVDDLSALNYLGRGAVSPEESELRHLNASRVAAASAREQWQSFDASASEAQRAAAEFDVEIAESPSKNGRRSLVAN